MNKNKGAAMEAARQRKAKRLGERGSGIYPSIKKAVAILLGQTRYDLQSAAASAGLSTQQLQDYLARPNVRAYMRAERKAQIESLCCRTRTRWLAFETRARPRRPSMRFERPRRSGPSLLPKTVPPRRRRERAPAWSLSSARASRIV